MTNFSRVLGLGQGLPFERGVSTYKTACPGF